jgi:YHS domain-containing protein
MRELPAFRYLAAAGLALFAAGFLHSAVVAGEINTGYFGNVAIEGYDPVAYFTEGKAVKGKPEFAHDWLGAEWHFANADHLQRFIADPVSYSPQYGGMCADGVAYGTMSVNIEPEVFSIIDGKLYLAFDPGANQEFEELPGQLEKAEANWPEVKARFQE